MYMFKYILKRIGLMLMTFCIIMLICFVLIKLLPIPINTTIGQDSEILKERLRARGYYDPILVQLFNYVKRIFTEGDFGIGVNMPGYINAPVWDAFASSAYGAYKRVFFAYRRAYRARTRYLCRTQKE